MAIETPCQTHGAVFEIDVSADRVTAVVELPHDLCLDADRERLLIANIHNVLELALAPHWRGEDGT